MSNQVALAKVTEYFDSDIIRARFREVLGSRESGAYISSVLLAVSDSQSLQECSLNSIYKSALRAATLRLSVDPGTGQAYLVPFKGQATLIVGYKGLQDMAVRTGKYRYINVGPVYEGEWIEEERISGFHKFAGRRASSQVIGWIAAFEMYNGYGKTMYMTCEEIHEHAKKYSKSYNNPSSGWKTDTAKMERKTVLRLLLRRWGYLDPSDAATLDEVEKESEIVEGSFVENVAEMDQEQTAQVREPDPQLQPPAEKFNGDSARPYDLATIKAKLENGAKDYHGKPTDKQIGLIAMLIEKAFVGHSNASELRHEVQFALFGRESLRDCEPGVLLAALNKWLLPTQDSGGDYLPDAMAVKEIQRIHSEALKSEGQQELL